MEEKKLTDEEIVKKLNYIKEQYLSYIYNDDDECKVLFVDDILDLIHRLQDENNQIKSNKFASWKLKFFNLKEEFDKELSEHEEFTKKTKAEIERLTEERKTANMHDLMYWFNAYNECVDDCEKYVIEASDNKAECIRLQKQVDELKERAKIDLENERNWGKIQTKQAVKDTAKEIFTDLLKEFSIRKSCGNADVVVREMASRKGVEVE